MWQNNKYQIHRENDLPALVYQDGSLVWEKNNLTHHANGLISLHIKNNRLTTLVIYLKDCTIASIENTDDANYLSRAIEISQSKFKLELPSIII